ncbi:CPBP family intramembrane glutamic endopeptidase [Aestuariivivens sediminis]|uniref:CPBP family intramembrane glutamic endopeptidase n=1 Tax=Aestuariivivens sediminis TaxID=2913557 RepID=UPI001F58501F|nr:type II CAAX endopeptidase family protein [Aestuariivivens sediminis]
MNRKKLFVFLILTFLWSWILWIIGLNSLSDEINPESIGKFLVFFFVGVYGPTISGIITTLFFDGLKGLFELIKKLFIWKVPFKYYLYIIFLPLIFVIIGIALYSQFIGEIGDFDKMAYLSIPTILLTGLYAGPLGEELGWRGFLLPEFQKKYSNLKSAIIIGFIWFVWHIPLWWAPFGTLVSGEPISIIPVIAYFTMLICLSIIITWLVINSKGSVLIAILFHLSINAGIALQFYPELNMDFKKVHLLSSIGMLIFTGFLVVKNKLKTITNTV